MKLHDSLEQASSNTKPRGFGQEKETTTLVSQSATALKAPAPTREQSWYN